jgi:UDP-N-acetylglucosamine 1-carboxyvinyltransferase
MDSYILLQQSKNISGTVELSGAKNAVLVIMASLILTRGKSVLKNVPNSADIQNIIKLMTELGAVIDFDVKRKAIHVDTTGINGYSVNPEIMNKMRASVLVMGPLLARFGCAKIALPGGCLIGSRPINLHMKGFEKMGVLIKNENSFFCASVKKEAKPKGIRIALEYPSVGATENIIMFASLRNGQTTIVNASSEPEVLDLISVMKKMGAKISYEDGHTINVQGVTSLNPVMHSIVPDRLEAGSLLLATSIVGGSIFISNARMDHMDVFLNKLEEMGHKVKIEINDKENIPLQGIRFYATNRSKPISFKTGPYPGFPTDLQAQTMAALCLANGTSVIEETVFENRFMHIKELAKMGAQIQVKGSVATVRGIDSLYGCDVIATDIRASCALVIAGLAASGKTRVAGVSHWRRGYDRLELKLKLLGCDIDVVSDREKLVQVIPGELLSKDYLHG